MKTAQKSEIKSQRAEILREYGPYPGMDHVHGVTFDGAQVWFARICRAEDFESAGD
jgi:hypothetical protein